MPNPRMSKYLIGESLSKPHTSVIAFQDTCVCSLVPRPLPDFISQLWRKIGRRPGIKATSWTGNGGLSFVMMTTCPRTMWSVLASSIRFDILLTATNFAGTKSLITMCIYKWKAFCVDWKLMGKAAGWGLGCKHVKTSVCTRATIIKEAQSQD